MAAITLADHDLGQVTTKIAYLVKATVPGVSEASVTLFEKGQASSVAFTGPLAIHADERQYERGYGPCLDSIVAGETVRIDSMAIETRWPDYVAAAQQEGVGSSISIPVPVQREVAAALNIYSTDENAFDDDSTELAETFAACAAVALTNMHLCEAQGRVAEQLQQAMQSRRHRPGQGILMRERRCTPRKHSTSWSASRRPPTASSETSPRPSSTRPPRGRSPRQ